MTTDQEIRDLLINPDADYPDLVWHGWSYGYRTRDFDAGVVLQNEHLGREYCYIPTNFVSRDGLRLVDAAQKHAPDRVQVSDHGAGRFSAQMFRGDVLVADLTFPADEQVAFSPRGVD